MRVHLMQQKHVHNVAILVNKALTLLMQLKYYIELKVSFKKNHLPLGRRIRFVGKDLSRLERIQLWWCW